MARQKNKSGIYQISVSNSKGNNKVKQKEKIEKKEKSITKIKKEFSKQKLMENLRYFLIGALGFLIATTVSYFLFSENIGIFTIILTTLFLMPYIIKHSTYKQILFGKKHEIERDGAKIIQLSPPQSKFKINQVYDEHKDLINLYLLFFLGVIFAIFIFILVFPSNISSKVFSTVGWDDTLLPEKEFGFEGQNRLEVGQKIILNNLSVLFVCFIFALIFPSAGILIIIWNAVFWGVVFTQYTLTYSALHDINFPIAFLAIFWSAIPHMIIEALAYFLATISGILFAIAIKNHFKNIDKFTLFVKYVIVLFALSIIYVILGSIIEIYAFDILKNAFLNLL